MPDYFRHGRFMAPTDPAAPSFVKEVTQWKKLRKDWEQKIVPYAKKHGAETFAVVGKI